MSLLAAEPGTRATASVSDVRGGVRVRERVIEKVARETSANTIGVPRDDVDVEVAEWGGGLAVRVAAKLPIPDLGDADAIRAARPVLDQARWIQTAVAEELARLTGREVRRVTFSVTGAIIPDRKRVR